MPIWKLDPIDLTDQNWAASRRKGPVIIRAPTEDRARQIAQGAFAIGVSPTPGTELPFSPWKYPNLVTCQPDTSTEYDEDGPDAILDPADYDHDWAR